MSDKECANGNILVVDDNEMNLLLLDATLRGAGYQVILARSGEEALERLDRHQVDLLLLDVMMPGMNGFELYNHIQSRPGARELPIIFISALDDDESINQAYELGAMDYITKPFRNAEVLGRVGTHLRLKRLQHSLTQANGELGHLLQRHKSIIDSVGEGIIGVNAEDRVTFMNPQAEAMLGYTVEALADTSLHETMHHTGIGGEDLELGACPIINTAVEGGTRTVKHDQFFNRVGKPFPVDYTVSGIVHEGGEGTGEAVVVFRDISERLETERHLEEAATVFEVSTEGITISDPNGTIVRVNPAFTEITGYSSEEVIGKNPRLLKSGYHEPEFYARMWEKLVDEGYWEGEIWNRRKDGSIYPEWEMIKAIHDHEGNVTGYVSQFSDITRRKLTEEEIRYRGNYDALTGLVNRSLFLERLEQYTREHHHKGRKLGLLFIDLDKFKPVNDKHGHAKGDILLKHVAERIKGEIRDTDTAARLGGDEFVVLLTDMADQTPCEHMARRLLAIIDEPFDLDGVTAQIGASIGVAVYPDDGENCSTLLRNADLAMYRAKEKGRHQAQFFTESMELEFLEHSRMEADLSAALSNNELRLNYQPIVDMPSGRIVGVESLIRWQHPHRGFVPPDKFIPMAETMGMINDIGSFVIETACKQLAAWREQGIDLYASVNVSAHQIPFAVPVEWLEGLMREAGLPNDRLVLEITESIFIEDIEQVGGWLKSVRDRGFKVYLDDFGTGYSSLSFLKRFPVDALKIDRMFINEIGQNDNDSALVRAILAMSDSLEMKVVAEGIETDEHVAILREMGCPNGQGYRFSRPLPANELTDLYLQQANN